MSGGGTYKRIYAWEPDERNLLQLRRTLGRYENITVVPAGMWREKAQLRFTQNGNAVSKITDEAAETVDVDTIDSVCAADTVTFIKMDIEGSERDALLGAENIIKRDKPRLAICIYHSLEDLYEIPFWIKETVPEYRLYIRHHCDNGAETVVYAKV